MSKNSNNSKNIPVFNLNVPGGGLQKPVSIGPNTPVYSSYTGELISNGPIAKGTISDAPKSNPNYGKPFHVIEHNPVNNTFMAHYQPPTKIISSSSNSGSTFGSNSSGGGAYSYSVGSCSNINIY
jgi:hypothetical protein